MNEEQAEKLLMGTCERLCCAFERIAAALEAIARAQAKAGAEGQSRP